MSYLKGNGGMKKVLILASVFPPMGGSGVLRIVKLIKYLPRYGYDPIVLTTKSNTYYLNDTSFDVALPDENIKRAWEVNFLSVYNLIMKLEPLAKNLIQKILRKGYPDNIRDTGPLRTRNYGFYKLANFLFVPDFRITWLPFAVIAGLRIFKKKGFEVILSTSPDNTTHLVGLILNKLTGIPWIADFQDPWVENPFIKSPSRYHEKLERFLERKVIENSHAVVSVSKFRTRDFIRRYPYLGSGKFYTVAVGYDPDDFGEIEYREEGKLSILHAGSFYVDKGPESFLRVVKELVDSRPDIRNRIEVNFIGPSNKISERLREKYNLGEVLKVTPYIQHKKVVDIMMKSDLLLLIPGPGEGTVPAKLFEYLAARKPVLLLSQNNSEVIEILTKVGLGTIANYNDGSEIKDKIGILVDEYLQKGRIEVKANESEIGKFSGQKLMEEFAEILNEVRVGSLQVG